MIDPLQPIRDAMKAGDKPTARRLIRPFLQDQPSAEAWYLAAQLVEARDHDKIILCLRKALALDPWHAGANRMLLKIEGMKPSAASNPPPSRETSTTPVALPEKRKLRDTALDKARKRRQHWTRISCLGFLILSMSCSAFTMALVGLLPGAITNFTILTGGPTPVLQIESTPIRQVRDAPILVPASKSVPAQQRDTDVLEDGYLHEYFFNARTGDEVVIYVQFLSLAAQNVSRNVVVIDPRGINMTGSCQRENILSADTATNVALVCKIGVSGTWKVRILGRDNESEGAYFVGVDTLQ